MKRARNFNAGPAALPLEVLQRAQNEWLNIEDSGMSVMELSHRSSEFEKIHNHAIQSLKDLMEIPENYEVLLLQGGASLQFSMIPMNILKDGKRADYVLTGSWSEKALKEAKKVGETAVVASSKDEKYTFIPKVEDIKLNDDAAYLHITSNNTIYGTQWKDFPETGNIPLVADMSSDILSKKIDINKFGIIYAGAQKNLGPSGITVVIIRKDLITDNDKIPSMMNYSIHSKNNSLYNTPPTLAIYLLSLVLDWAKDQGGVEKIAEINEEKAKVIYDAIDGSDGFYKGHALPDSRSLMNVTFTLPSEEAEVQFLKEVKEAGFVGLNGHRSIGGCRASIYNAVPLSHCQDLADFMKKFQESYNAKEAQTL
ncbi:3-phosphoserine/phosphohydroxythreonine transaminase [Peribacillus frigoritolerans]|uniref:3-phosphoserine/phosphohydroxythreonine transaminase n=1 Tax=Bacillaceae TaxID=186817 RepID=UPI001BEC5857|nr:MULTISPECIES: 3-phosphoserine/phosphohydroxythreonine transaminase [unclassified Bacillus (in: firmicutes)]MBT2614612.1 3-phosphoserine/phosphohydroxythreonine transaminase [Bacillus sp. ISL-78]MBT2632090.1 3-phosphoserine/phosphohydroxythreonine transaminase [Bacillus sp. ISL-101]MBT2715592.1 3-phosphoserine/phosphohydroxythreonine transaminase [Bacillus sp. ISL-57]